MAKIIAPNAEYNDESAGIKFENGVAETDDVNLTGWFRENGYAIEETETDTKSDKPLSKMSKSELCAVAESKGITVVPDEMTKAQIIAALRG